MGLILVSCCVLIQQWARDPAWARKMNLRAPRVEVTRNLRYIA